MDLIAQDRIPLAGASCVETGLGLDAPKYARAAKSVTAVTAFAPHVSRSSLHSDADMLAIGRGPQLDLDRREVDPR